MTCCCMKISLKCLFEKPSNSIFSSPLSILHFEVFFSTAVSCMHKKVTFLFFLFFSASNEFNIKNWERKNGRRKKRGNWILKQYHHRKFPPFSFHFPFSSNLICNLVQEMWKHHEMKKCLRNCILLKITLETWKVSKIGSLSHLLDPLPLILIIKVSSESIAITSHHGDIKKEIFWRHFYNAHR